MAIRTIVPERDFSQGEVHESPPLNAQRLERFSRLTIHRLNWPDTGADVIRVTQWYSPDNGQTWQEFGGFTARGGTLLNRDGSVMAFHSMVTSAFPGAENDQRRIRVTVEALAPLRTKIDAETSESILSTQSKRDAG
jgi:hypothetical protein